MNNRRLQRCVSKVFFAESFPSTMTSMSVFAVTCGVLVALVNLRAGALVAGDTENIRVPIATNAAVSWAIATLFCLPFVVNKAFQRTRYFNSCLAVSGWPIRGQFSMLGKQFLLVLIGGGVLAWPIAAFAQAGFWRVPRAQIPEMLFPESMHQTISLESLVIGVSIASIPLIVAFVRVLSEFAFGKIRDELDPKPVKVLVSPPRLMSLNLLSLVISLLCFWGALKAGDQAGLFVILAFVILLLWAVSSFTLVLVRILERIFASGAKRSSLLAMIAALLAELHGSIRGVLIPLVYIATVPAIVLSVGKAEAIGVGDPQGGIMNWDFTVLFLLPLLYVGVASLVVFYLSASERSTTERYLIEMGAGSTSVRATRFVFVPLVLLGLSLACAFIFSLASSMAHTLLMGSPLAASLQAIQMNFTILLLSLLAAVFVCIGIIHIVGQNKRKYM